MKRTGDMADYIHFLPGKNNLTNERGNDEKSIRRSSVCGSFRNGLCKRKSIRPNHPSTRVVGVSSLFAPPADFDPVTASDDELASYALPPRRDATSEPQTYASWKKAMLSSKGRVFGELEVTNHYNGTPKLRKIENGAVSSGN
jgi:hypothetical protein